MVFALSFILDEVTRPDDYFFGDFVVGLDISSYVDSTCRLKVKLCTS